MKIIVDTNIIFSGLLNTNGSIGDLIFNSEGVFQFYSCDYMRHEIDKHWVNCYEFLSFQTKILTKLDLNYSLKLIL